MSKRAKRLSYWAKLNELWESGSMPQEQFCKEQGVDYNRFVYWRAQVLKRDRPVPAKPRLIEVTPSQKSNLSHTTPQPAEIPSVLEVELPSGVRLHIKSNSDIGKASALIKQLGGGL